MTWRTTSCSIVCYNERHSNIFIVTAAASLLIVLLAHQTNECDSEWSSVTFAARQQICPLKSFVNWIRHVVLLRIRVGYLLSWSVCLRIRNCCIVISVLRHRHAAAAVAFIVSSALTRSYHTAPRRVSTHNRNRAINGGGH